MAKTSKRYPYTYQFRVGTGNTQVGTRANSLAQAQGHIRARINRSLGRLAFIHVEMALISSDDPRCDSLLGKEAKQKQITARDFRW